ncbi:MAG: hypothetical protein R3C44_00475 [Chloroflexota bacterium]
MGSRVELISRIIGAIVLAIAFGLLGTQLATMLDFPPLWPMLGLGAVGGVLGLLFTPALTIRPVNAIRHSMSSMPLERLLALIFGVFIGLIAAALFSIPLAQLPTPFKQILPLLSAIVFCYLGAVLTMGRCRIIREAASTWRPFSNRRAGR